MDKEKARFWNDYITMIERSKEAGEKIPDFFIRTEGEGYFVLIPVSTQKPMIQKTEFCRQALASRKEREPIRAFYKRMSKLGYDIEYKQPGIDKDKKDCFRKFVKEVLDHAITEEPLEGFISRMEKKGFTLTLSSGSSDKEFFIRVIEYLNSQAETEFRTTFPSSNSQLVLARKSQGYTWEDFKMVIDKKVRQWLNTEFEKYLRPKTLFTAQNFENYVGEKETNQGTRKAGASQIEKFAGGVEAAKAAAKGHIAQRGGSRAKNSH